MAILTYIDSNTLIYYAKGPGLDLLSNLNSQLIITDAVEIEATQGTFPAAGIIADWINANDMACQKRRVGKMVSPIERCPQLSTSGDLSLTVGLLRFELDVTLRAHRPV